MGLGKLFELELVDAIVCLRDHGRVGSKRDEKLGDADQQDGWSGVGYRRAKRLLGAKNGDEGGVDLGVGLDVGDLAFRVVQGAWKMGVFFSRAAFDRVARGYDAHGRVRVMVFVGHLRGAVRGGPRALAWLAAMGRLVGRAVVPPHGQPQRSPPSSYSSRVDMARGFHGGGAVRRAEQPRVSADMGSGNVGDGVKIFWSLRVEFVGFWPRSR